MKRVLFCVGCNKYAYMRPLGGAENDARRIYKLLVDPLFGDYDATSAILLLSPTKQEFERALDNVFSVDETIDTLTIFFAGHGGVKAGSYYMCLSDSSAERLSTSAFSLSQILLRVGEQTPTQTFIIIDSCEAGGLSNDLGTIIKSSILGDKGTPAITLLATSAQDQMAGEYDGQGLGTRLVCDCIEGKNFVQDLSQTLDLIEIARHISSSLSAVATQTPVTYGLNIFGLSRFCKNPYFRGDKSISVRELQRLWPEVDSGQLDKYSAGLWELYEKAEAPSWDAKAALLIITDVLKSVSETVGVLASFVDRFSAALVEQGGRNRDAYRTSSIIGVFLAALLRDAEELHVQEIMRRLQGQLVSEITRANATLIDQLASDKFALLDPFGGMVDLYYLPIRVSQVLGWLSFARLTCLDEKIAATLEKQHAILLEVILQDYEGSIAAITDDQAAPYLISFVSMLRFGDSEAAETILCLLFLSFAEVQGRVSVRGLEPALTLSYLMARANGDFTGLEGLISRPSEFLVVLLSIASAINLDEVVDPQLWKIDGVTGFCFLPDSELDLAEGTIESGQNHLFAIGDEVCRLSEFRQLFKNIHTGKIHTDIVICGALCASLLLTDRVPWFLLGE